MQDQEPYAPRLPGPVPQPITDSPSQPVREPYSPFRMPTAPVAAPPPKQSRRAPLVALAVFGLVVAAVVTFAALRNGKPSRSRDDVIKRTFAALASGDEDALFELADPVNTFTNISRCEKPRVEDEKGSIDPEFRRMAKKEEADYRDPKKVKERWSKDLRQLVRRTKGAKLKIADILTELPPAMGTKSDKSKRRDRDDDDRDRDRERERDDEDRPERDREYKTTTFRKGDTLARGCYAKVPFRQQQVKVAVDIKDGEREFTQLVKVTLLEIDGNWYLSSAPSLNVGFDVVLEDLQDWRDKACKCSGAGCVEDLDTEYGRLAYAQYDFDKDADMPRETVTKIEKLQQERKVCEATARGGPELARYKALKESLCACKDEECGKKIELEMVEVRKQLESTTRAQRIESYDVTRQITDVALAATECTRKLAQLKPRIDSAYPTSGETTGGTLVWLRGSRFMTPVRTAKVFFGNKEATVVRIVSDSEIVVEAPPADTEGYVLLRVQLEPGGLVHAPWGFTYKMPLKPIKPAKKPKPTSPL